MANAIHACVSGDTVQTIIDLYYVTRNRGGDLFKRDNQLVFKILQTANAVLEDADVTTALAAGLVLKIPTTREVSRACSVNAPAALITELQSDFETDLCTANALQTMSVDELVALLEPATKSYTEAEVRRFYYETVFLDFDGMDTFSAAKLVDTLGIETPAELLEQTPADLASILDDMVSVDGRPAELAEQQHHQRWREEAKLRSFVRLGQLHQQGVLELMPGVDWPAAEKKEDEYRQLSRDESRTESEANQAELMARLYGFQAKLAKGLAATTGRQWSKGIRALHQAERLWEGLAEHLGVTVSVNGDYGMSNDDAKSVCKAVLEALPTEDEAPLGVSPISLSGRTRSARYRLRSFRMDELTSTRRGELMTAVGSVEVHQFPRITRSRLDRLVGERSRLQLDNQTGFSTSGLNSGPTTSLSRDLETQDRRTLARNSRAATLSTFDTAGLDLLSRAESVVPLAEVKSLAGTLWDSLTADDVLSTAAADAYPSTGFLDRTDVTPFTRFVVMPDAEGGSDDVFLPITASFTTDYESFVFKKMAAAGSGELGALPQDIWDDITAFAAFGPYFYSRIIPTALGRCYAKTGRADKAAAHGWVRCSLYAADKSTYSDRSGMSFYQQSSTGILPIPGTWSAPNYSEAMSKVQDSMAAADLLYRNDDRNLAAVEYRQILTYIEEVAWGGPTWTDSMKDFQDVIGIVMQEQGNYSVADVVDVATGMKVADKHVGSALVWAEEFHDRIKELAFYQDTVDYPEMLFGQAYNTYQQAPPQVVVKVNAGADYASVTAPIDVTFNTPLFSRGLSNWKPNNAIYRSEEKEEEFLSYYFHAVAMLAKIDAGLNWYGYRPDFVPPWSFDHLFNSAMQMCNRAIAAEDRVMALWRAAETAVLHELGLEQAQELGQANVDLAKAKQGLAEAQVAATTAQSALMNAQAELNFKRYKRQTIALAVPAAVGAVLLLPAAAAAAPALAVGVGTTGALASSAGATASFSLWGREREIRDKTKTLTSQNQKVAVAATTVAEAEVEVANMVAQQSTEMLSTYNSLTFNSDALYHMTGILQEVADGYGEMANLLAWLAQRALIHETRREFATVSTNYLTGSALDDLTRGQRLTQALESLRAEYTVGQVERLEQVKWTIRLSQLSPGALAELRESGEASFLLHQSLVDRAFPGMYLHRVQDLQLDFVGSIPTDGVRGRLQTVGMSWVRVPNSEAYTRNAQLQDDWVTTVQQESGAAEPYTGFVSKVVQGAPTTFALSTVKTSQGQVGLRVPQGMLKPVEHQGLDSVWALRVHPMSNDFSPASIQDVELTFWFLAQHDAVLEEQQKVAWNHLGETGQLTSVLGLTGAENASDQIQGFLGTPDSGEGVDLRLLSLAVPPQKFAETSRRLLNVDLMAVYANPLFGDITLTLRCDRDPVGLTLPLDEGMATTAVHIDPDQMAYECPLKELEDWVVSTFYGDGPAGGNTPSKDPGTQWVLKATAAQAGSLDDVWTQQERDGSATRSSRGALQGTANGSAVYDSGTSWTDYSFSATARHLGGTLRLRVRDTGTEYLAAELGPSSVKLLRSVSGSDTTLAERALSYDSEEFLRLELRVYDRYLELYIDQIKVLSTSRALDSSGALGTGTIGLEVTSHASDGGTPIPVEFDDVLVRELTVKGVESETLLDEGFDEASPPDDWSFVDGAVAWQSAIQGHKQLDLSALEDVVLRLEYAYQLNLGSSPV